MKNKIKDTDYLFLSAYIHAKEPKLIGRSRLERMLDARTPESALKILEDAWQLPASNAPPSMPRLEGILTARRNDVFSDLARLAPAPEIVDAFRVKYDYHNVKALVKGRAANTESAELLSESGRVPVQKLRTAFEEHNYKSLPPMLGAAMQDAVKRLAETSDPQRTDFALDKAYMDEFRALARDTGSAFLLGYVKLSIDAVNLRAIVRSVRANQTLLAALQRGGNVTFDDIVAKSGTDKRLALFRGGALSATVDSADAAISGGSLTEFERQVDNALLKYLAAAKQSGFSEKPLIGYIGAVESEIASVRVVMTGQFDGLPSDTVKLRLRDGFSN